MQLMVEGDKLELYIPSDMAYGERGSPPDIPPHSALIFKIEMIKIEGGKVPAMNCDPATLEGCDDRMKAFVEKAKTKFGEDRDALDVEIERLMTMSKNGGMKEELRNWIDIRIFILQQMMVGITTEEEL